MENKIVNTVEGFDGETLHPSLDIKGGILILGFRYKGKDGNEREIFLLAKDSTVRAVKGDSWEVNGKSYFFETKGRKLVRIEERWSLSELNKVVAEYSDVTANPSVSPVEVFQEVKGLAKRFIELEKEIDYTLVAAWAIGTYFFPIFAAYPFLNPKAPKRSGKSQFLNFLKQVCFNASKARPSLAALGDTVDSLRGTYLIDQADSLGRKGSEELLDILADSYKKGGGRRRILNIDKGKRTVLELDTYSPKAVASIRNLPEDLQDRFLIIPLMRSRRNFPDPDDVDENWSVVRARLYRFLIWHYGVVVNTYLVQKIEYRKKPEMVGRVLELWLPLETMLTCLGAPEEEMREAKKRFLSQYGFSEYEPSEMEEAVVKTVLEQFEGDNKQMSLSPRAISEMMDVEAFPGLDNARQKAARVGWTFKKFNLFSEKQPRTKEGVCYLFEKEKVENVYKLYFGTELTSLTPPQENHPNKAEIEDVGL